MDPEQIMRGRRARAIAIARAGGLEEALEQSVLQPVIDTTLAEALVLGLLRQGVHRFISVLGHGSTEVGEVLRLYEDAGVVKTYPVRSEVEASHAAAALRWVTGGKAAVVTSIGPGALQALSASLVAASDSLGVWYLFGDEPTEDEGPNMQQIPGPGQNRYLRLCEPMGGAYCLHTPAAVGTALRRGLARVDAPAGAGPFFLLMPLNTQPAAMPSFHLDELPSGGMPPLAPAADKDALARAAAALRDAGRVVVKVGGGATAAGTEIARLLELSDGVAVLSPVSTGTLPHDHPRNMQVGGSKGTLCGNHAMERADLLVALGTRAVCQSDCSRTGYPDVKQVININADPAAAVHYARTIALVGDVAGTLRQLNEWLEACSPPPSEGLSFWLHECTQKRDEWRAFQAERFDNPTLHDPVWGGPVLTQPAAIRIATDWARSVDAVSFFDAGDVQTHGFQAVQDDRPNRTFSEAGASYMGFATSALLATGLAEEPFYGLALTGDGSFMMNPQVLLDGVEHGARGCILLLDNRRMAAISSLQVAQYGADYATRDHVAVDYVAMAGAFDGVLALDGGRTPEALEQALEQAHAHDGLSLVHVPVYYGDDPLGGLGAFGRWNVGNWVKDVQRLRHDIGL